MCLRDTIFRTSECEKANLTGLFLLDFFLSNNFDFSIFCQKCHFGGFEVFLIIVLYVAKFIENHLGSLGSVYPAPLL